MTPAPHLSTHSAHLTAGDASCVISWSAALAHLCCPHSWLACTAALSCLSACPAGLTLVCTTLASFLSISFVLLLLQVLVWQFQTPHKHVVTQVLCSVLALLIKCALMLPSPFSVMSFVKPFQCYVFRDCRWQGWSTPANLAIANGFSLLGIGGYHTFYVVASIRKPQPLLVAVTCLVLCPA